MHMREFAEGAAHQIGIEIALNAVAELTDVVDGRPRGQTRAIDEIVGFPPADGTNFFYVFRAVELLKLLNLPGVQSDAGQPDARDF